EGEYLPARARSPSGVTRLRHHAFMSDRPSPANGRFLQEAMSEGARRSGFFAWTTLRPSDQRRPGRHSSRQGRSGTPKEADRRRAIRMSGPSREITTSSPMRGALLGVGRVAIHGHVPGWRERDDVKIVAAADLRPEGRKAFEQAFPEAHWYDASVDLL